MKYVLKMEESALYIVIENCWYPIQSGRYV